MNRMIRMMSGVLLAAGAVGCNNDAAIELSGEPTMIQATPQVMFIEQGAEETLYLRLTDEANFSVEAGPYTVTDKGPGIDVVWDSLYRMDYLEGTLTPNPIQVQHRYVVTASQTVRSSFKVSNSGITQEIEVIVIPTTLGNSISSTAPGVGEAVTLTLPANLSFTTTGDDASTISVGDTEAIISEITATTVTFIPIPGSSGTVSATGVTADYDAGEAIGERTLESESELSVPAIETVPLVFSSASPAPGATVTVSAAGYSFDPNVSFSFGGAAAFVLSVAADGSSAVILPPLGVAGLPATVSNFHPTTVPSLSLSDIPSVNTITTAAGYPAASAGGTTLGTAVALSNAVSPTQGAFAAEAGPVTAGADVDYLGGGNQGGPRYYVLTVAEAGTYQIDMAWEDGGGDYDLYVRDDADGDVDSSPSGANPESVTVDLEPGTYYIVFHNWHNSNDPGDLEYVLITVKPVAE